MDQVPQKTLRRSLIRFPQGRETLQLETPLERITRFAAPVSVSGFELPVYWWNTGQQLHVKHARASVWRDGGWHPIYEYDRLPEEAPLRVDFSAPVAGRAFKLEVLRRSVPPAHLRAYSNCSAVVFWGQLDGYQSPFRWIHTAVETPAALAWDPPMRLEWVADVPAPGLRRCRRGWSVDYDNGWLRAAFSGQRPQLRAFSWDSENTGRQSQDLLHQVNMHAIEENELHSGPVWEDPERGAGPRELGGEGVCAHANGIDYIGLRLPGGATLDAGWRMSSQSLDLELCLRVPEAQTLISFEAWRWVFDLGTAVTACLARVAEPFGNGSRGRCAFPAVWHAPNFGNLSVELVEGDPASTFLRVESWRQKSLVWFGVELGVRPREDGDVDLLPGEHRAVIRFRRGRIGVGGEADAPAFRRTWATDFGFRPEAFGLSNNSASSNCLFCAWQYADVAAGTAPSESRRLALDMVRYTLDLALRGGAGYGQNREAFLDTASSLVIAAGVVDAADADHDWLRTVWPALRRELAFLRSRREGGSLVIAPLLTGNRGERIWSSNWWDVVCFGHQDAYCNTLAFRAFSLGARLAAAVGDLSEEQACRSAAADLRAAFVPAFFNPSTGWLGGWRSRDGELHDYAFLFVNGLAISFGLVDEALAREILLRLEAKRQEVGLTDFGFGLPGNLVPVPLDRTPVGHSGVREDGADTYGYYENGGLTASMAYGYVRALGLYGFAAAEAMGEAMLRSFEDRVFISGLHRGSDWRWWDGTPCGYEGLLVDQVQVLLAIAQNRGLAADLLRL